jgi:hypothetical protein
VLFAVDHAQTGRMHDLYGVLSGCRLGRVRLSVRGEAWMIGPLARGDDHHGSDSDASCPCHLPIATEGCAKLNSPPSPTVWLAGAMVETQSRAMTTTASQINHAPRKPNGFADRHEPEPARTRCALDGLRW